MGLYGLNGYRHIVGLLLDASLQGWGAALGDNQHGEVEYLMRGI